MFDLFGKKDNKKKNKDNNDEETCNDRLGRRRQPPFTFDDDSSSSSSSSLSSYKYPSLYEEADEMLQVSMLIYSLTDLRSLAKNPNTLPLLKYPESILQLPLSLHTCLEMIENNYNVIKKELPDHENTISSLQTIYQRYHTHDNNNESTSSASSSSGDDVGGDGGGSGHWLNPFASFHRNNGSNDSSSIEIQNQTTVPMILEYGDDNPDSDMVYAIGIDPKRKRITVAFRGSVTSTDFVTDAKITMNHQSNTLKDHMLEGNNNKYETIGIHQGFYDYLLATRENNNNNNNNDGGKSKLEEIIQQVNTIFLNIPERQQGYKLYVTGHSLGGALATLFSLYLGAAIYNDNDDNSTSSELVIPYPISCISVASPRVGDKSFQGTFTRLEQLGIVRHLRIANDRDPVPMMPRDTGKKIWAMLSPISYAAFKIMDNQFEEKETFRHTGVKLLLAPEQSNLFFLGFPIKIDDQNEDDENISSPNDKKLSQSNTSNISTNNLRKSKKSKMPDVTFHLGKAYTDNMASVKSKLSQVSLNDIYKNQVASIVAKEGLSLK